MNKCHFVGEVYRDVKHSTNNGVNVARFILAIKDYNNINYVPFVSYKSIADKAILLCKKGNQVAVESKVYTKEHYNQEINCYAVQISFIATDIMLLTKGKKNNISNKTFNDLVDTFKLGD